MPKCPVCKTEYNADATSCSVCGFTELHVEFVNVEEARAWERTVLRPCRALWRATDNMYKVALQRMNSLSANANKSNLHAPPNNRPSLQNNQPESSTDGELVSHQDFTTCRYPFGGVTVVISNVKSTRNANGAISITYLVKKMHDKKGSTATTDVRYRYKLKDPDGVIFKNDYKIIYGLKVGDTARETLVISNPVPGQYGIEFVDMD